MGPSGSGKSTLMHCLAGLDTPSAGRVVIGDTELTGLSDKAMTVLRRDRIGFVFQSFNLVPTLTARENITLPCDIAGRDVDQQWMDAVVSRLGLSERLDHRPSELSGGQQQRVACARASSADPPSSLVTSRPATSTPGRRARSCRSCAPRPTSSGRPSSSSRTTRGPRPTPTALSSSPMVRSSTNCATLTPTRCSR